MAIRRIVANQPVRDPAAAASIEVDGLDESLSRARAAAASITCGLAAEAWRRFFLRDPDGTLVNILQHASD